jgi:hypothetical protein
MNAAFRQHNSVTNLLFVRRKRKPNIPALSIEFGKRSSKKIARFLKLTFLRAKTHQHWSNCFARPSLRIQNDVFQLPHQQEVLFRPNKLLVDRAISAITRIRFLESFSAISVILSAEVAVNPDICKELNFCRRWPIQLRSHWRTRSCIAILSTGPRIGFCI